MRAVPGSSLLKAASERDEWKVFVVLFVANRSLTSIWGLLLIVRCVLPALFGIAIGGLVGAVEKGAGLTNPLTFGAIVFVLIQVLTPIHEVVGANLGDNAANWLSDCLTRAGIQSLGIDSTSKTEELFKKGLAFDSDRPSNWLNEIAVGLGEICTGLTFALVLSFYHWWMALALCGAWLATHWRLRENSAWRNRRNESVNAAIREEVYYYGLAVDPPAAKEIRLFGLSGWLDQHIVRLRTNLYDTLNESTRLHQRPLLGSFLLVLVLNFLMLAILVTEAVYHRITLGALVVCVQSVVGTSMISIGGLNWLLDRPAGPVAAVLRLEETSKHKGVSPSGARRVEHPPYREILFRQITFAYPSSTSETTPVLKDFEMRVPAGALVAIVGQNGAGKTTLAKLLCRLYEPQEGAIDIDGIDLRQFDLDTWRASLAVVFQDFIRFEMSLRDNVAPHRLSKSISKEELDAAILESLAIAGAEHLKDLDTVLAPGYPEGIDLSGGEWQRIALARALCAVRLGASVILLDEPTAQLDLRSEAEIFERIRNATRHCTTILISHRLSIVRHADLICVLESSKITEAGTHKELLALGGSYRRMFDLQAAPFNNNGGGR